MAKKLQLAQIFNHAKAKGVAIRFGDLMRQGFHPVTIKNGILEHQASLDYNSEGYSIVIFRSEDVEDQVS